MTNAIRNKTVLISFDLAAKAKQQKIVKIVVEWPDGKVPCRCIFTHGINLR